MSYKLGSLFDGSGGFPLAGSLCGIDPRWASEVEPYPIAVTRERFDGNADSPLLKIARKHFPDMKLITTHLGDISKINGAEIEPVDIITFGSPCQDLSVAGKRAGLKHKANGDEETTRSGLFMEAVRIIKEMREATNGEYPRFALWENVPGAFSSNKGEDFRVVCEELIKIIEPTAFMPPVPKAGWAYADSYVGDGWSLAYRVFDAQYWGVPQRRRRIHLVVDFRGERAREVLFERQGVRGYFTSCENEVQETATNVEGSTGADDREGENNCLTPWDVQNRRIFSANGQWPALYSGEGGGHGYAAIPYSVENHPADSRVNIDDSGKVQTLTSRMGTGGGNVPLIMEPFCKSSRGRFKGDAETWIPGKVGNTLNTFDTGESRANELVVESKPTYCLQGSMIGRADKNGPQGDGVNEDVAFTCNTIDRHAVAYAEPICVADHPTPKIDEKGKAFTLNSRDYKAPLCVVNQEVFRQGGFADYVEGEVGTLKASGGDLGGESENLIAERRVHYIVRRLTPTECARLQGFADAWGHIEQKDNLTDEEYRFWLEVRNTHAAINGREEKEYTKKQILTWYNKLYTDSAEYKMWGNGIALPPALYVLQGMADVLSGEQSQTSEAEEAAKIQAFDMIAEQEDEEPTDLSDAPEKIKTEIIENAEKLEIRASYIEEQNKSNSSAIRKVADFILEEETTEEETMEQKNIEEQATKKENTPADFCAVAQLRRLAEERKALANLRPEDPRFSNDVRAIEYAVNVLEAVGL